MGERNLNAKLVDYPMQKKYEKGKLGYLIIFDRQLTNAQARKVESKMSSVER